LHIPAKRFNPGSRCQSGLGSDPDFNQFPNDSPRIRFEPTTLQLQLIDHVIIGIPGAGRSFYFGFKEAGVIS
jgi:hypothetical protein